MTRDQAITRIIRALQAGGIQSIHKPTSTLIVKISETEYVSVTVGMVKTL